MGWGSIAPNPQEQISATIGIDAATMQERGWIDESIFLSRCVSARTRVVTGPWWSSAPNSRRVSAIDDVSP